MIEGTTHLNSPEWRCSFPWSTQRPDWVLQAMWLSSSEAVMSTLFPFSSLNTASGSVGLHPINVPVLELVITFAR